MTDDDNRARFLSISLFSLALGLVFCAFSFTPSLIPRSYLIQGALAGLVTAIGYMIARLVVSVWRGMELWEPQGRLRLYLRFGILALALVLLIVFMAMAPEWQDSVRLRVGMAPVESTAYLGILALAIVVFAVLFAIGALAQRIFDVLRFRLYRIMRPRAASLLGLVVVLFVSFTASRDWVLPAVIDFLDNSYEAAQDLFETAPPQPDDPMIAGSNASLVSWAAMGQPGRNYVTGAPKAADIAAFSGTPAKQPIRVYVGRSQDDDPMARAELALKELIRLKAFDRKALLVMSPTGTGWLDPGAVDTFEYIENGDVASVAVQYSYLQSPLALIFETRTGLDQASATMRVVYDYWRSLPADHRPKLYMHGISLGAWSSMYSFDMFDMINEPVDGALWAGPPFPSDLWNRTVASRDAGSPYVLPKIGSGEVVRFASQYAAAGREGPDWGRTRIIFLQYASDPIVFFEPDSFFHKPRWMREPPAPDVSKKLRYFPIVTEFQLAVDMALSKALPEGYGHNYVARDYIDAWLEILNPSHWSDEKTDELKDICRWGEVYGCKAPDAATQAAMGLN
ncbi:alpha/beta-hydrolase family protein [Martelella sp. HB161492]|uniref:alpha/beta hydrolase n=1 Tax=Martelella sp. HB161492 TaxID=2720726 RepID=UPI0032B21CA1